MNLIEVNNIYKGFDDKLVVNGISFEVRKGEVFGLLGPNGAGKTTTISMMSAQMKVTSGSILVKGMDASENASKVKCIVGVVPQEIALYSGLSAYDNLQFFGSLYGLKPKELNKKIMWVLEMVGLEDRAKEPIKNYSGGMKRRINIAAALLHDPDVVFMDEPTVGIDPQSRNRIYEMIQQLKDRGMTIIYTTHYMEEATLLCDRIAIVDEGTVIEYGETKELIAKLHGGIVELELNNLEQVEQIRAAISDLSSIISIYPGDQKISFIVEDQQEAIGELYQRLKERSISINRLNIQPPTLETLFLQLTGKDLRE